MRQATAPHVDRSTVWTGFTAMLPVWVSAIPIGIAYSLAARDAGLSPLETQTMSLLVFSAATQLAAIAALGDGESILIIAGLALSLNTQLLLFGLAAGRRLRPYGTRRLLAAGLLTDGSFAVASSLRPFTTGALIGAGASMYVAWNLGTALGLLGGSSVTRLNAFSVDVVGPLIYVAALVPLLRRRGDLLLVGAAALVALVALRVAPAGAAVLAAAAIGALIGIRGGRPVERGRR